jgi:hypothetical protein
LHEVAMPLELARRHVPHAAPCGKRVRGHLTGGEGE